MMILHRREMDKRPRKRSSAAILLVLVLAALLTPGPSRACPEETVVLASITLQRLQGRIKLPEGQDRVPGFGVSVVVQEAEAEESAQWSVPVLDTGEFDLSLPEGTYEYSLSIDGFFFTLIGMVVINAGADSDEEMILDPPWC